MAQQSAQQWCRQSGIDWHEADNAAALGADLAERVAQLLQQCVDEEGAASLVVSGGSTPRPVFNQLCDADIAWSKVCITLADERWVPPDHADSNESMVRDMLLRSKAAQAGFVPLYSSAAQSAEHAMSALHDTLSSMHRPFSVTILGMGSDGHTASLFPDAPAEQLRQSMELHNESLVAVLTPPSVEQVRVSLTRAALLNSRQRILHITGTEKRDVLAAALAASSIDGQVAGEYVAGLKPIVGLMTTRPEQASVYWSR